VKIHTDINTFSATNPVVTIGTFDGVHLGHRKVIDRLNEVAAIKNGESVIFTFYPHPRLIVQPNDKSLRLLTTLEERTALLESLGVGHLIIYPFTREFSELSYADFVRQILVDEMKTRYLVVGYDHRFGKNREGSFEYLQKNAAGLGFEVEKLDALLEEDIFISSSKIRNSLELGEIEKANHLLGYWFTLHGKVVEGIKMGRKIGFPTANIEASDIYKIIPGYGVYAVKIRVGEKLLDGMLNIGTRPTFNHNADKRSIEVNIFDFNQDIYGEKITLYFAGRIREERKFKDADELVGQLKKDREISMNILKAPTPDGYMRF
jgi:riboflavin kinase/FMN adenylyltransferase